MKSWLAPTLGVGANLHAARVGSVVPSRAKGAVIFLEMPGGSVGPRADPDRMPGRPSRGLVAYGTVITSYIW